MNSGENQIRKISYNKKPISWLNIPCNSIPATYEEFISAAKKKFNDNIFLMDEDGIIIEEDTFNFFEGKTISIQSKESINAEIHTWQDIPIISASDLLGTINIENTENGSAGINKTVDEPSDKNNIIDTESDKLELRAKISGLSGGLEIIETYESNRDLNTGERRKLVNLVVFLMIQQHGKIIPKPIKMKYADELIKLFPSFKDVDSKYGYEAFFDPDTGLGFFTNRLKTVNRRKIEKKKFDATVATEPTVEVAEHLTCESDEELQANLTFLEYADPKTKKLQIEESMKKTFDFRRKNPTEILLKFPRFLDTPSLINLDFELIHPNTQIKSFPIERILELFENDLNSSEHKNKKRKSSVEVTDVYNDWDTETKSILTLLRQLPPSTRGRDKKTRGSIASICQKLIVFCKTGNILKDVNLHTSQPCLVAVGPQKNLISNYYIVLEKQFLPVLARTAIEALDQLLKSHYVFNTSFDDDLKNFFKFIEIVFYSLGNDTSLTPRMREIRTKITREE